MYVVVLSASPRKDGNSRLLGEAVVDGARSAGHAAALFDLEDHATGFVRDCRRCRRPDGECAIEDGYRRLLFDHVLAADALVYATPIYWYGMAARLKNWIDRLVCYVSASHPRAEEVVARLRGTRVALLLVSEEHRPGVALPVVAQVQEIARYLHQPFVGVVHGIGNTRGEVAADPADPVGAARALGARIADLHHSDYRIDTPRPGSVWSPDPGPVGSYADP